MVWPLKKKKKIILTVLGVFFHVFGRNGGITCVLQQYCSIENTSNCQKCVVVFFVVFFQQVNGQCYVKSGYIVVNDPEKV